MIQAKCIQKFRDKSNRIYGYRLQDLNDQTQDVKPENLKQAIANKQIHVVNLTLTSDGRLVDTTEKQLKSISLGSVPQYPKSVGIKQQIKDLIAKSKQSDLPVIEITTACNHKCYIISKSETQHIIYIPDDVTKLNKDTDNLDFTNHISNLQGTLKVVGGKNLINTSAMFYECKAQSIDLRSFNTSNVTNMSFMFWCCEAQSLNLRRLNTSKVTNMNGMFWACKAQSLDLSSFDTSNVKRMIKMFWACETQSLDLSSFNTSKVTSMDSMFKMCEAKSINISSFDTSNVTDMSSMFEECQAQSLDLRSFNTSNVTDMVFMFEECQAQSIDLSSFDTSNVADMCFMFEKCQAQSLDISSFSTSNVTEITGMFRYCEAKIKATDSKILEEYERMSR